jgi:hypothetical protein
MNNSHKTAIHRNVQSAPLDILYCGGFIGTPIRGTNGMGGLDYGCGFGKDAEVIGCDKYDPHFYPVEPRKKYKYILCTYVLNVLEKEEAMEVCKKIQHLLERKGEAFITVRRDIKKTVYRNNGTLQRPVYLNLPSVYKTSHYEIYRMSKYNEVEEK